MEVLPISISSALSTGFDLVGDCMDLMMNEPMVYFVAMALIGAGAGVTKKFVPSKRR